MTTERIAPHSLEAEQSVLGACFMAEEALDQAGELLTVADFYDRRNRLVFNALTILRASGQTADVLGVAEYLRAVRTLDKAGGGAYVHGLTLAEPTTAHLKHYAGIVRDYSIRRSIIAQANQMAEAAFDLSTPPEQSLEEATAAIVEMASQPGESLPQPLSEVVGRALKRIEYRADHTGEVLGLPTGFIDLDRLTGGLQAGDLVVVAGRPGTGKSALAFQVAYQAAELSGKVVLFVSAEMSEEQLSDRLVASGARVNLTRVRGGHISELEWKRIAHGLGQAAAVPMAIMDAPAVTLNQIRLSARRMQREGTLGLVVVDYMQLMRGDGRKRREEEIAGISRGLKALAKELKTPVMALSQLNRQCEMRDNKRPRLSDLRESGSIEQDADVVIFIYRDELYDDDTMDKGIAEIGVAKQRQGPAGIVRLRWGGEHVRFDSLAQRGPSGPGETPL